MVAIMPGETERILAPLSPQAVAWRWHRRSLRQRRTRIIDHYVFPSVLRYKVQQRHAATRLDDAALLKVEAALRQFFRINAVSGRRPLAMPSQLVDDYWHEFILHTREYQRFCKDALGRFLHHTPASRIEGRDGQQRAIRRAWVLACQDEGLNPRHAARLPLLFGIDALFGHDIDVLVTPDPLNQQGLCFEPVFDYEQVLVVGKEHRLRRAKQVEPEQLAEETLITYPVSIDRLDIFSRFLTPAGVIPKRHKLIETTDIILQMVACGRGVAALPRWLVKEQQSRFEIYPVRLGKTGVDKQIFVGYRQKDREIDYLQAFVKIARSSKSFAK